MKTYLVTGASGFLGSHLSERLLADGNKVVAIDNFVSSSGNNLIPLKRYQNFNFIKADVRNPLSELFKNIDLDGIFNLACPASPPFYQKMPIETNLTSVLGAKNVLDLATERGIKVLQTSTSEVYGDPEISPQPETYRGVVNCFGPRACYDEGKRAAESLFYDYNKQKGTNIRIVRIFNTYGPNMLSNDGRVVSNFITQALKGEPITIYGTGTQTRSFCYVDDLLDGLMCVWSSNYQSPVNIGNPVELTMLKLAELIINFTDTKSELIFKTLPIDDPLQRKPDITLAKSLGWRGPLIPLDIGLGNTIYYFKSLRESGKLI